MEWDEVDSDNWYMVSVPGIPIKEVIKLDCEKDYENHINSLLDAGKDSLANNDGKVDIIRKMIIYGIKDAKCRGYGELAKNYSAMLHRILPVL